MRPLARAIHLRLDDLARVASRCAVPTEDALLIAVNLYGIASAQDRHRARVAVRLGSRPTVSWQVFVPLNAVDSPFCLDGSTLLVGDDAVGGVRRIDADGVRLRPVLADRGISKSDTHYLRSQRARMSPHAHLAPAPRTSYAATRIVSQGLLTHASRPCEGPGRSLPCLPTGGGSMVIGDKEGGPLMEPTESREDTRETYEPPTADTTENTPPQCSF